MNTYLPAILWPKNIENNKKMFKFTMCVKWSVVSKTVWKKIILAGLLVIKIVLELNCFCHILIQIWNRLRSYDYNHKTISQKPYEPCLVEKSEIEMCVWSVSFHKHKKNKHAKTMSIFFNSIEYEESTSFREWYFPSKWKRCFIDS